MSKNQKPFFHDARIQKANTDISGIQMETRHCKRCGVTFDVSKSSPQRFHSLPCAELPQPGSWMNGKKARKVAEHLGKTFKRREDVWP